MTIFDRLIAARNQKGSAYLVLIDPDRTSEADMLSTVEHCVDAGVDGILVGSSLLISNRFNNTIQAIKKEFSIPVIIFPGSTIQLSEHADAVLFLSLISGRNPEFLIGTQVLGAPIVKKMGLEAISTGYMLIESGKSTSAEFMSNSKPIPRDKSDIAVAHALAAEYLGMKCVYLEAGSGAIQSVPEDMIEAVTGYTSTPVIVGGGIRTPEDARKKVEAGASFVVTGNVLESKDQLVLIKELASAVHWKGDGKMSLRKAQ
ncbi:MAG: geranylgeranylglyceryl/heptaprenylglyceryl phosphate synthase [Bacteroidetes bacterium]|nr:geranylgeranylglyceryl/heptaprenylglyceryl phosphate synthase [Bacteroidota bacterium]